MGRTTRLQGHTSGFTLIELLIVVAIIVLLGGVVIATISEVREKNRDAERLKDISELAIDLELYKELNGEYPVTDPDMPEGGNAIIYGDPTCEFSDSSNDVSTEEWIPGLVSSGIRNSLPQNPPKADGNYVQPDQTGADGEPTACYQYVSDGRRYILSAWGVVENGPIPTDHDFYSKAGFKEVRSSEGAWYYENWYGNISGENFGYEDGEGDHYRHSYTYTNVPEFEGI